MTRQWSITDQQKGVRTIREALKYGSLAKSKQKFSYQSNPVFPFIPTSNVIIDSLHLFLRIGDNLINLLITELLRIDSLKKSSLIKRYEEFLNDVCKVPFKLFSLKDSKKTLEWCDLTGPEKHRLFT